MFPDAVGVAPSTHTVYVTNASDGTVSVIDGTTNAVTATLTGFSGPDGVGVDPSMDAAYVSNFDSHTVSVISWNPPSSYPSGYHQLVADNSGLCVDVYQESTSNYAAIDEYTCKTTGQANQEWRWNPVLGGYGQLQSQYSGKDLVVTNASTAAGAKIVQYDQNGTANGLWKPIVLADGSWQFQNLNSGQCLDVPGASTSRGVQLIQWLCSSSPLATGNQAFATR